MFTGIIRAVGQVIAAQKKSGGLFLTVAKPKDWEIRPGDSIATNGVCLTVRTVSRNSYTSELMPETLARTCFGRTIPKELNLEQSLRLSDRLGGHLVTGHIDALGQIQKILPAGLSEVYQISFPPEFAKLLAAKGSIAVDGVSLTVVQVGKNWFTVSLVDFTLKHTTLGQKKVRDFVNLEFDIIAKYIHRYARGGKSKV